MLLTPHRTCLSTATLACFPTRPLLVRLQTKQSLPAARFPFARPHSNPSSEQSHMPSRASAAHRHPSSLTSTLPQAIQTP